MTRIDGTGNPFSQGFSDQCTWWAQQRYHKLTGIWTPCTGNGYQWVQQASINGWLVMSRANPLWTSIICIQPGIQGADSNFGHVGVVERVNADGSVYTSNFNISPHLGDKVVVYRTFLSGYGVSFISAGLGIGSLSGLSKLADTVSTYTTALTTTYTLSANPSIGSFLQDIDNRLKINNPFDIGFTLSPLSWLQSLGSNLVSLTVALIARLILILLGVFILKQVLLKFVDTSSTKEGITNILSNMRRVA